MKLENISVNSIQKTNPLNITQALSNVLTFLCIMFKNDQTLQKSGCVNIAKFLEHIWSFFNFFLS